MKKNKNKILDYVFKLTIDNLIRKKNYDSKYSLKKLYRLL